MLVIVIVAVVLLVLLRKKFINLLMDIIIGTVVYLILLFLINWIGLTIPLTWAEIGYPIMLVIFVAYHIINNGGTGQVKKWGAGAF